MEFVGNYGLDAKEEEVEKRWEFFLSSLRFLNILLAMFSFYAI